MDNTPKSDTVKMRISEIRERCRELLEERESPQELELEDPDEPGKGRDPYNQLR